MKILYLNKLNDKVLGDIFGEISRIPFYLKIKNVSNEI